MDPIGFLTEPLQYGFLTRALAATLIASVVCAVLSCWLILMGWALMGDAVSHAVLPGVVLSYLAGWPFAVGAFAFGMGGVLLIGRIRGSTRLSGDTAIGVVFTGLFALGLVMVSKTPSQTDLTHILFGNVLGVGNGDLLQIAVISLLLLGWLAFKGRDLTLLAFDRVHAHAVGINTGRLSTLLLAALALTVVVSLQSVGIILVVAMLITPGATAYLLTRSFRRMVALAVGVGVVSSVVGLYASYYTDSATGATVVLIQAVLFLLAWAWHLAAASGTGRTQAVAP